MRSLFLGSSLLLASVTNALPEISISKRDKDSNGATAHYARSVVGDLTKRQSSSGGTVGTNVFDVLSWSFGGAYYANVTVGTPPQPQTVILDTGSSDLYFDASSAPTCEHPPASTSACEGGTYDLSKSSTYKEVDAQPAFNTSFGDGSTAIGPYGSDVVGIGDVLVSPVQFGVANEVNSTTGYSIGLMGIGYATNEAVTARRDFYSNMPEVLKNAGVINSRLYSIWLNDERSESGTILFGGIDKSKYTGTLATVDLLPAAYGSQIETTVNQFITTVTGCNATVGGKTSNLWSGGSGGIQAYSSSDTALPVLLDTGSTAWSIPTRYYNAIARLFTYIDRNGITSCSHVTSGDSLSLEIGGKVTIHVDVSQFVVPIVNATTRKPIPYDNKGNNACAFLLSPSDSSADMPFEVLGDAILRSMYIVFDLDNAQASIAQAAQNVSAPPNIVTVQAGPTGVAAAVGSGVATAASNTFLAAAQVQTTTYSVSTAKTTIGTATGNAAVPADAQVVQSGSSGSGSGSGSGSTSSGAAAGIVIPSADFAPVWITGLWIAGIALGFGVMM